MSTFPCTDYGKAHRPARIALTGITVVAAIAVVALCLAPAPSPAAAQNPGPWAEHATAHFLVVYPTGQSLPAGYDWERFETIYQGLVDTYGTTLETPITVRLYPTVDAYLAANPLAQTLDGQVVNAHHRGREFGLPLSSGAGSTKVASDNEPSIAGTASAPESAPGQAATQLSGLDNIVRYELAHQFLIRLSNDRLPPGWREGMARYMAAPDGQQAAGVARLREAWRRNGVPGWSMLAAPGAEFLDPPLSYPASLAVAHFLVDRFGFATLAALARSAAEVPGWRQAVAQVYGRPSEQLEAEWRTWLPSYLDGGWQQHALYRTDLAPVEAQLARGDYRGALASLAGLTGVQMSVAGQAGGQGGGSGAAPEQILLEEARQGTEGLDALRDAYQGLAEGDYTRAADAARQAQIKLSGVAGASSASGASSQSGGSSGSGASSQLAGPSQAGSSAPPQSSTDAAPFNPLGEATALLQRAELGQSAASALTRAQRLPPWRALEARWAAYDAAARFGQLGNDLAAGHARSLAAEMDRRLAPLGALILVVGLALLAYNVRARWRDRAAAMPAAVQVGGRQSGTAR